MRKFIRYLFIGLGAVILLMIASMAIFVAVFDANAYKEDISKLVREQTGRELQFQGDIGLTIFPALGMELGSMSFSNAAGFGELPMVRVGLASVSVDLVSLLRFAPEIDKLILRDLEINLIRNKAGVNNWDDLVKQAGAESAGAGSDSTSASKPKSSSPSADEFELKGAFAGLEIDNLKLLWRDEQVGEEYRVTDLDISTGHIAPNESFPLSLHLDASGSGDLNIAFDLKTQVGYLIEQQQLTLSEMTLALNQFEIGGQVQVSNFANPVLRFNLASKVVDVDELLGILPAQPEADKSKKNDDGKKVKKSKKKDKDVKIALPMQMLRDLDIDGDLVIARLKMLNMKITDLEMHLSANDGLVALKPVRMKAYNGRVESAVVVDVRSDLPRYGVSKTVKGVQVGKLLKDYMGEAPVSGKLNLDVNLTTSGEWLSKLKKNSNGTMSLAFLNGALNGFNIRHSIDTAKAKFGGDDPPKQKTLKTDFTSLTVSGVIKSGVFSSKDLDLQAPLLRVSGKGSADLNKEVVDYLVNAKIVGSVEGQKGDAADDLAGLKIPVHIKGPFTAPEIDVQYDEVLKAKLDKEKEKLKAKFEVEEDKLKADIDKEKKALEKQLKKEKKKLKKAQQRELEKKLKVEKAKAERKARKKAEKELLKILED